jgi:PAS domain S-box-containing protein
MAGSDWKREWEELKALTEQLRIEKAKAEAISDLKSAVTGEAIFVHVNGVIIECNWLAAQLYGAESPSELIGRSIYELMPPDEAAKVEAFVTARSEVVHKVTGYRKDGTTHTVYTRGMTRKYNGHEIRVTAILSPTWTEAVIAGECDDKRTSPVASDG